VSFDNPVVLLALALILPLGLMAVIHYRRRRGVLAFFPSSRRGTGFREIRFRYILSSLFFLLFFAFLIVSLAGPRWGTRLVPEFRRGADVVLAIDLSRSMDVRDGGEGGPSRLERSAAIARELVTLSGGARFAVAVGKGAGVLAVPLTDDAEAVMAFLEGLSTSLITGRGTNLESLITAASGAFQSSFPTRRRVILFSDGEAHQGIFSQGIEKALAEDISIAAVGLGSEAGGVVPGPSSLIPAGGRAEEGPSGANAGSPETVMSFLRRDTLRNAAERTGGIYLDGTHDYAAALLADHIAAVSPGIGGPGPAGFRRERVSRSYIFIIAALIFLGLSKMCGKKRRKSRALPLLSLVFFFTVSCSDIPGKLKVVEGSFFNSQGMYTEAIAAYRSSLGFTGTAPYGEYGLGVMYLSLDEGEAALGRFAAAEASLADFPREEHRELRYGIYYNRGVIRFRNEDYAGAAEEFRKALEANSSHIEAKRNLELSLLSANRQGGAVLAPLTEGGNAGKGDRVLFDYLRNKEQDRWRSREWVEDTSVSGPDY
jgi:Ca-activated chloride channel family protein